MITGISKAYGDCEGPLGFPMRSSVAKVVEDVLAHLNADCKQYVKDGPHRVMRVAKDLVTDTTERTDVSLITSEAVDRDNEVMMAAGGDWSQFSKNPTVTFAHKYTELPVGRSLWAKQQSAGWVAKTRYSTRPPAWEGNWFADAVFHLVNSGDLPGKSVGFVPLEARLPTSAEIVARPEMARVKVVFIKWMVLEYAVAPVQSNPDALVQIISKAHLAGIELPDVITQQMGLVLMGDELPELKEIMDELTKASHPPQPSASVISANAIRQLVVEELKGLNVAAIVKDTIDRMRGKV